MLCRATLSVIASLRHQASRKCFNALLSNSNIAPGCSTNDHPDARAALPRGPEAPTGRRQRQYLSHRENEQAWKHQKRQHSQQQLVPAVQPPDLGRSCELLLDACCFPSSTLADITAYVRYNTQVLVPASTPFWSRLATRLQQTNFQPIRQCTSPADLQSFISVLQATDSKEPRLWSAVAGQVAELVSGSPGQPSPHLTPTTDARHMFPEQLWSSQPQPPPQMQSQQHSPPQEAEGRASTDTLQSSAATVLEMLHRLEIFPPPAAAAPLVQAACQAETAFLSNQGYSHLLPPRADGQPMPAGDASSIALHVLPASAADDLDIAERLASLAEAAAHVSHHEPHAFTPTAALLESMAPVFDHDMLLRIISAVGAAPSATVCDAPLNALIKQLQHTLPASIDEQAPDTQSRTASTLARLLQPPTAAKFANVHSSTQHARPEDDQQAREAPSSMGATVQQGAAARSATLETLLQTLTASQPLLHIYQPRHLCDLSEALAALSQHLRQHEGLQPPSCEDPQPQRGQQWGSLHAVQPPDSQAESPAAATAATAVVEQLRESASARAHTLLQAMEASLSRLQSEAGSDALRGPAVGASGGSIRTQGMHAGLQEQLGAASQQLPYLADAVHLVAAMRHTATLDAGADGALITGTHSQQAMLGRAQSMVTKLAAVAASACSGGATPASAQQHDSSIMRLLDKSSAVMGSGDKQLLEALAPEFVRQQAEWRPSTLASLALWIGAASGQRQQLQRPPGFGRGTPGTPRAGGGETAAGEPSAKDFADASSQDASSSAPDASIACLPPGHGGSVRQQGLGRATKQLLKAIKAHPLLRSGAMRGPHWLALLHGLASARTPLTEVLHAAYQSELSHPGTLDVPSTVALLRAAAACADQKAALEVLLRRLADLPPGASGDSLLVAMHLALQISSPEAQPAQGGQTLLPGEPQASIPPVKLHQSNQGCAQGLNIAEQLVQAAERFVQRGLGSLGDHAALADAAHRLWAGQLHDKVGVSADGQLSSRGGGGGSMDGKGFSTAGPAVGSSSTVLMAKGEALCEHLLRLLTGIANTATQRLTATASRWLAVARETDRAGSRHAEQWTGGEGGGATRQQTLQRAASEQQHQGPGRACTWTHPEVQVAHVYQLLHLYSALDPLGELSRTVAPVPEPSGRQPSNQRDDGGGATPRRVAQLKELQSARRALMTAAEKWVVATPPGQGLTQAQALELMRVQAESPMPCKAFAAALSTLVPLPWPLVQGPGTARGDVSTTPGVADPQAGRSTNLVHDRAALHWYALMLRGSRQGLPSTPSLCRGWAKQLTARILEPADALPAAQITVLSLQITRPVSQQPVPWQGPGGPVEGAAQLASTLSQAAQMTPEGAASLQTLAATIDAVTQLVQHSNDEQAWHGGDCPLQSLHKAALQRLSHASSSDSGRSSNDRLMATTALSVLAAASVGGEPRLPGWKQAAQRTVAAMNQAAPSLSTRQVLAALHHLRSSFLKPVSYQGKAVGGKAQTISADVVALGRQLTSRLDAWAQILSRDDLLAAVASAAALAAVERNQRLPKQQRSAAASNSVSVASLAPSSKHSLSPGNDGDQHVGLLKELQERLSTIRTGELARVAAHASMLLPQGQTLMLAAAQQLALGMEMRPHVRATDCTQLVRMLQTLTRCRLVEPCLLQAAETVLANSRSHWSQPAEELRHTLDNARKLL